MANLAILTHFENEKKKKMNNESLLKLRFVFVKHFNKVFSPQAPASSHVLTLTFHCLVFFTAH